MKRLVEGHKTRDEGGSGRGRALIIIRILIIVIIIIVTAAHSLNSYYVPCIMLSTLAINRGYYHSHLAAK